MQPTEKALEVRDARASTGRGAVVQEDEVLEVGDRELVNRLVAPLDEGGDGPLVVIEGAICPALQPE